MQALIRLHHNQFIHLTKETVCGYFIFMFQYFMEHYAEITVKIHYLTTLEGCVRFADNGKMYVNHCIDFAVLLWRLPQDVHQYALNIHKHPSSWNQFVDQLNQCHEVIKLRRDYLYAPFLFTMNIEKAIRDTNSHNDDDMLIDS